MPKPIEGSRPGAVKAFRRPRRSSRISANTGQTIATRAGSDMTIASRPAPIVDVHAGQNVDARRKRSVVDGSGVHQQGVDGFQILIINGAGGLLQQKLVEDEAVASL